MVTHTKLCQRLHDLADWPIPSLRHRWAQAVAAGLLPKARPGPGGAPPLTLENVADFLICIAAAPTIDQTAEAVQVYGGLRLSKHLHTDGREEVRDPPGKSLSEMVAHFIRMAREPDDRKQFQKMKPRVVVYQSAPLVDIMFEFADGTEIVQFTPAIEGGLCRIASWHRDRARHPGAPHIAVTLPPELLLGVTDLFGPADTNGDRERPNVREPLAEVTTDTLPLAAQER